MANTYTYTYDDFRRRLEESGIGGQFSDADLALAERNPDAGMSLLNYKLDYAKATTPEARALANQEAERIRSDYGGYTGGKTGGADYLNSPSPGQFTYDDAPSFNDRYADRIDSLLEQQQNRTPYEYGAAAPTYESRYDPQIQDTIAGILGRGEFSYDPKTDPVYSAYQKQYTREGQRATADALGQAAAATGGMPSSYAVTAATQAGDYYAAQMADKIPQLYQDAYNRYLQEYQMKLSDLSALRGLESDDYNKYRDQLSQYNTDRSFDYAKWLDEQQFSQQDLENLRNLRADELDLYRTQLGQYNTDRDFGYSQYLDEITNQRTKREDAKSWAETAAKYGDYSFLKDQGVDTSSAEYADLVSKGVQAAQYGDYSLLQQAGIDTSTAQFKEQLAIAQERAAVGDYSGYAALGVDTSNAQLMDALNIQAKQASIASTYANMPTEEDRALERAYQQARIASAYAGIPTEEERALENAYKEAQIYNYYNKGSGSSSSGTDGMTYTQMLKLAEDMAKRGDYSLMDSLAEELGYGTDYNAVDEASAAGMRLKSADDLDDLFDYIRERKAAGDPEVQTAAAVSRLITRLDGYKASTMQSKLDAFISELFSKKTNKVKNAAAQQTISAE